MQCMVLGMDRAMSETTKSPLQYSTMDHHKDGTLGWRKTTIIGGDERRALLAHGLARTTNPHQQQQQQPYYLIKVSKLSDF